MKKKFHTLSSIILYYIFCFLINASYEEDKNYIKKEITINEQRPFISDNDTKFLISLSSPIIFIPENVNDNKSFLYTTIFNDTFNFSIRSKSFSFLLNNKKNVKQLFYYGSSNSNINNYGFYGLARDKNRTTLNGIKTFLEQLLNSKLISKDIIYIEPYYNNNTTKKKSNILIGIFPESLAKNRSKLPFCDLKKKNNSINYYDCNIGSFLIEYNDNNNKKDTYLYKKDKDLKNTIIARFEEGSMGPIFFPQTLFKVFQEYFKNHNCSCNEYARQIECDLSKTKNMTISLIINNFKFILNPEYIWKKEGQLNKLNIEFNRVDEIIVLTSGFTGYYHRIYDNVNYKIYFSDDNNKIISLNKEGKSYDLIFWIIFLSASFLVLVIAIIVIIYCTQNWKQKIADKITSISFQKQRDEEEDGDGELLE